MSAPDHSAVIDALRRAGAGEFDPVHLHYLEVLASRASAQRSNVQRILDLKLMHALAAFKGRFEQAHGEAKVSVTPGGHRTPLGDLATYISQQSPEPVEARVEEGVAGRSELKSIRNFRNTWSKLSVDKQVTLAIGQAPKNAGPINSHMLVLRSLALMRDISPDYLNRFMSYADTLLCLDQSDTKSKLTPKKPSAAKMLKK